MAGRMLATAGSKLEIAAAMSFGGVDLAAGGFPTTGWVEVGGTTDLGSNVGDTSNLITSEQVSASRTRKAKGTRNAGSMAVVCDLDPTDPGQLALIAAEKTPQSYAFRFTLNDAPPGGKPSQRLFVAFVMSTSETYSGANSVQQLNATLEIDSNIVRVAATNS